ncbi:hypothetical protein B296_00030959 [Ensete ventricosum]|uniref:Uncharacterized protein n=1 Tax=Ensete ventricosum TaxID=4639 RepID=A0A427AEA3_ENSVE|nr:hypothetical protein B296_00030959 [Ensete ventricosum]
MICHKKLFSKNNNFHLSFSIQDSLGKNSTQLLRHCVRLLVLVSTDLVAVRLSGIQFSSSCFIYSNGLAPLPRYMQERMTRSSWMDIRFHAKVCNIDGYRSYRVRTGPLVDWGCFRPVTTKNRSVMVDFNLHQLLLGGNGRFRPSATDFGWYQLREKEEEGEEKGEPGVWRYSLDPSPAGDFFSPHGEKEQDDVALF